MKTKKRKIRRKIKIKNTLVAVVILLLGITCISKILGAVSNFASFDNYYIASDINKISLYTYDKEQKVMSEIDTIYRGTKVKSNKKNITVGDIKYTEIKLENKKYYVKENVLVENKKDTVKETTKYVRTSVTVYKNETESKIASFIKKGNKLDIQGYDYLDSEGNVNMYKITKDETEGWVYGKYLVDTETDALANYNENGIYDIHKNRKYSSLELYGGKASTLDYYPYEKVDFEDNPLLKNAKAMYLNAKKTVIENVDEYLKIATSSGVNAIVVDIKDGFLAYPSPIAKEYTKLGYEKAQNTIETYKAAIQKIKKSGIYVIGRIVVFNDYHFGTDNPDECIKSDVSKELWPSAYSRKAWEYNVELAKEAIDLMKFNEIQFDYVRFPETAYRMSKSKNTDFKNTYDEEKAETIQNFLMYATDEIHKKKAYLSVDVFGEASNAYVTAYGQYLPAISNIVDVVSSMPYTDHFDKTNSTYWTNPYKTVYNWAKTTAQRQKEIETPALARTWITAYDTPNWKPTVVYDAEKISDQAQALVDAGLTGGFITWNGASSLKKYDQIKTAFTKDYK